MAGQGREGGAGVLSIELTTILEKIDIDFNASYDKTLTICTKMRVGRVGGHKRLRVRRHESDDTPMLEEVAFGATPSEYESRKNILVFIVGSAGGKGFVLRGLGA